MRAILARGGGGSYNIAKSISSSSLKEFVIVVDSVKTQVLEIHPYRTEFTYNSKIIIDNMFQEHIARRYLQIKTVAPTYLAPIASVLTKVNTTAIIGFTVLGSLYLFQRAERNRWHNQNDEVLIDGIVSLNE